MANKRNRIFGGVAKGHRKPNPARLLEPQKKGKDYRRATVIFYTNEADWVDETTKSLQVAGNAKANRSLVVREGILRLMEDLNGKSPEETLRYFTQRQAKRGPRKLFGPVPTR